jgi:CyaY protein
MPVVGADTNCVQRHAVVALPPTSAQVRSNAMPGPQQVKELEVTEAEFLGIYKQTLISIEETVEAAINEHDAELDYESGNDMLTLSFRDGSVAIISRQSAISQLWLAARSGGFHYDWDAGRLLWICTATGQSLPDMLRDVCLAQGGVAIRFD